MNVDCSFCDAKYTVSEDLVRGREARFRCRKCGGTIAVDGTGVSAFAPVWTGGGATADQLSMPPISIPAGATSSAPPAPRSTSSVPGRPSEGERARVARWIAAAGSFGMAAVLWAVLSSTGAFRRPVVDVAPVAAAASAELMAPVPVEPAATTLPAEPPEPAVAAHKAPAAPGLRGQGPAPSAAAERETAEPSPAAMPSSGYLPDPEAIAPAFDKREALVALDAVAARAKACKPEDTLGATRVAVTFAPTGKVTTAVVEGPPFAGTRVGGCIAASMRNATIAPFSGGPVTVHRSF